MNKAEMVQLLDMDYPENEQIFSNDIREARFHLKFNYPEHEPIFFDDIREETLTNLCNVLYEQRNLIDDFFVCDINGIPVCYRAWHIGDIDIWLEHYYKWTCKKPSKCKFMRRKSKNKKQNTA